MFALFEVGTLFGFLPAAGIFFSLPIQAIQFRFLFHLE
jgi:hypothetical protein